MRRHDYLSICLVSAALLTLLACDRVARDEALEDDSRPEAAPDLDIDTDVDTDSDADLDTDTGEVDTDTESGADTDGDIDTDDETDEDTATESPLGWFLHDVELIGFQGTTDLELGDLDGDGDLDLALGAYPYSQRWVENVDGEAFEWSQHFLAGYSEKISIVDLDVDGEPDILGDTPDEQTWLENDGDAVSFTAHELESSLPAGAKIYGAADFDGDSDPDLFGVGGVAATWYAANNGDASSWSTGTIDSDIDSPSRLSAVDMDGDGDLDLLGYSGTSNQIVWWENETIDADPWPHHFLDNEITNIRLSQAADLDGDGDLDVYGSAWDDSHALVWWENLDGDGSSWSEHLFTALPYFEANSVPADLDDDGDLDLVGGCDGLSWWENLDGDGGAWVEWELLSSEDVNDITVVRTADLDFDEDLDVIFVSVEPALLPLAWLENDLY